MFVDLKSGSSPMQKMPTLHQRCAACLISSAPHQVGLSEGVIQTSKHVACSQFSNEEKDKTGLVNVARCECKTTSVCREAAEVKCIARLRLTVPDNTINLFRS